MSLRQLIPLILLSLGTAAAAAGGQPLVPDSTDSTAATYRPVDHEWLVGIGRANVLDTYLSRLEYTGTSLSVTHTTLRPTRRRGDRLTRQTLLTAHVAAVHSPTDDYDAYDADLWAAMAWHWRVLAHNGLALYAGGMAEAGTGFTYNEMGGNNPAQGRLTADAALTLRATYAFRCLRRPMALALQTDIPVAGVMFAPHYGQSYYEIFALGQTDRNVRLTTPFSAPSLRLLTTLHIPLGRATLSVGYRADVRQSDTGGLRRHLWNNQLVVGYVHRVYLAR